MNASSEDYRRRFAARFYAQVDTSPGLGQGSCHMWTGPPQHRGVAASRGVIYHLGRGRQVFASHAALYLADGAWPTQHVLHTCDVAMCVRRDHLYEGTPKDNAADMVARGRLVTPDNRGARHGLARLTPEQVRAIVADPRRQLDIAADYGITQPTVSKLKSGKRWGHV